LSGVIAEILKEIEASGVPYQLTPTGTCLEADWDTLMPLVRKCHEIARKHSPHVITLIKLDDDAGESNKLARNVRSVEEKVGHPLATSPPSSESRTTGLG